jgi:hypothetical protein
MGEVKGNWEPIITREEFERGLEILRLHDDEKSRTKKHFYLLQKLLWLREKNNLYRMYVTMPTGKYHSYAYYMAKLKPNGKLAHVMCDQVEVQIPEWLNSIVVDSDHIPAIRKAYQAQLKENTTKDRDKKYNELKHQLSRIRDEETRLGRLLITEKISQEAYDQLRKEWKEKQRHLEISIAELERETALHLDDLEVALLLMTKIGVLFQRLAEKGRATLLQIIIKRIIINREGEIIDHELNSPFAYLRNIADSLLPVKLTLHGSGQVRSGAP